MKKNTKSYLCKAMKKRKRKQYLRYKTFLYLISPSLQLIQKEKKESIYLCHVSHFLILLATRKFQKKKKKKRKTSMANIKSSNQKNV